MLKACVSYSKNYLIHFTHGYAVGYGVGSLCIFSGKVISLIKGGKAHENFLLATPQFRRKIVVAMSVAVLFKELLSDILYKFKFHDRKYNDYFSQFKKNSISAASFALFLTALRSHVNTKHTYNIVKKTTCVVILLLGINHLATKFNNKSQIEQTNQN